MAIYFSLKWKKSLHFKMFSTYSKSIALIYVEYTWCKTNIINAKLWFSISVNLSLECERGFNKSLLDFFTSLLTTFLTTFKKASPESLFNSLENIGHEWSEKETEPKVEPNHFSEEAEILMASQPK